MQITGSISDPLNRFKYKKEIMVGAPIRDYDGKVIGAVTKVDLENNLWYGFVKSSIVNKHTKVSFEIKTT